MVLLNYIGIVATPDQQPYLIICSRRAKVKLGGLVGSHYRPIINCQLDPKGEEAIIYIHTCILLLTSSTCTIVIIFCRNYSATSGNEPYHEESTKYQKTYLEMHKPRK